MAEFQYVAVFEGVASTITQINFQISFGVFICKMQSLILQ